MNISWAKQSLIGVCLLFHSMAVFADGSDRLPFYEARKGDAHIYILGTMHVDKADNMLRQEIARALAQSSKLVQELSDGETLRAGFLMASSLCADACLRRQISEQSYRKLVGGDGAMLASIGLERMPAWMVSTVLALADYEKAGYTAMGATEIKLKNLWGNRTIDGLETAQEQIMALASLDDGAQREMLESHINTPEEKRLAMVRELHNLWRRGDADAIYQWYQRMSEEEGVSASMIREIDEQLNTRRNHRFMARLPQHLVSGKSIFLAVGALHLGGPQGVLALLREQGYTISAVAVGRR